MINLENVDDVQKVIWNDKKKEIFVYSYLLNISKLHCYISSSSLSIQRIKFIKFWIIRSMNEKFI